MSTSYFLPPYILPSYRCHVAGAAYAHELINESIRFERGEGGVPSRLWHYPHVQRDGARLAAVGAWLRDEVLWEVRGCVCANLLVGEDISEKARGEPRHIQGAYIDRAGRFACEEGAGACGKGVRAQRLAVRVGCGRHGGLLTWSQHKAVRMEDRHAAALMCSH